MKQLSVIVFGLFLCAGASSDALAQRKAVSGAEVTGTFRSCYPGKYKGFCNEILIQALGGNKLKIEMNLIYPYESTAGMNIHDRRASGEAVIQGDTAVFTPEEAHDKE